MLRGKIEENTPIPVSIPDYGEEYVLDETLEVNKKFTNPAQKQLDRLELIDKMQSLEDELEDMKHMLKEDIQISNGSDGEMDKLNNHVNDLRRQIVQIMNKEQ